MSRRLLDTDILSEIIKGKDRTVAARAAAYLEAQGEFTTSAVTVAEVVFGLRRIGREDRIAQFEASLVNLEVLPFDEAAARLAGRINADLQNRGRAIGMPDVMIWDCVATWPAVGHRQRRALRVRALPRPRTRHRELETQVHLGTAVIFTPSALSARGNCVGLVAENVGVRRTRRVVSVCAFVATTFCISGAWGRDRLTSRC